MKGDNKLYTTLQLIEELDKEEKGITYEVGRKLMGGGLNSTYCLTMAGRRGEKVYIESLAHGYDETVTIAKFMEEYADSIWTIDQIIGR